MKYSRKCLVGILPFLFMTLLSFNLYSQEKGKFKIIVDTDMAIDDWPALLYVLNQRDRAKLLAVTVPGSGEAHCPQGVRNVLDIIKLTGREREKIPVACGDSVPMDGVNTFPDAWRTDVDRLYGITIPQNPFPLPEYHHPVPLLKKILMESDEPVVILTLGPLTNIGQLIQMYPEVKEKIKKVYVMGGVIAPDNVKELIEKANAHSPGVHHVKIPKGNVIVPNFTDSLKNYFAEWNIWIDPLAAQLVFRSGLPVQMVGLNATNEVQVTRDFAKKFKAHAKSAGAEFTDDILDKNGWFIDSGEYFFWDPLTAVAVFEDICKLQKMKVDVNADPEPNKSAKEQLEEYVEGFAKKGKYQFLGKLNGRNSISDLQGGRTFKSDDPEVKEIEVCMGVKDKNEFFKSYMQILNKY